MKRTVAAVCIIAVISGLASANISIVGDVAGGNAKLIITEQMDFTMSSLTDPVGIRISGFQTGNGAYIKKTLEGGLLGLDCEAALAGNVGKDWYTKGNFNTQPALESAPEIEYYAASGNLQIWFSNTKQGLKWLNNGERTDVLEVAPGQWDLPAISGWAADFEGSWQLQAHLISSGFAIVSENTSIVETVIVPEPATMVLLGLGGLLIRRKQ
ncbi:MAG: PEP-CTERM sorting domain-containing protein [Planctomycetota bacterium]|jgi:hypothetical protein